MLEQLRQRNVHRAALTYLAGAWLIIQIVDTLTPDILPDSAFRATVIVLAIGLIPSPVLVWIFEWTPEGLLREPAMPTGAPAPDSRRVDRAILEQTVEALKARGVHLVAPIEHEKRRPDGSLSPAEIRDPDGNALAVIGVIPPKPKRIFRL